MIELLISTCRMQSYLCVYKPHFEYLHSISVFHSRRFQWQSVSCH